MILWWCHTIVTFPWPFRIIISLRYVFRREMTKRQCNSIQRSLIHLLWSHQVNVHEQHCLITGIWHPSMVSTNLNLNPEELSGWRFHTFQMEGLLPGSHDPESEAVLMEGFVCYLLFAREASLPLGCILIMGLWVILNGTVKTARQEGFIFLHGGAVEPGCAHTIQGCAH